MKILIIGHSVEDHVITDDNGVSISPGGVFYSALSMESIRDKNEEIFLMTSVSEKNYNLFAGLYDKLNKKYFQFAEVIPKVNLTLCREPKSDQDRLERYENITDELVINLDNINEMDGILINMITGFDINLSQLKEIRSKFKGLIYFDVHTLSRGLDEKMNRKFRLIPEFKLWAECLDIIQANEFEIFTLSDKKSELEIAKEILSYGVKILIVTKEKLGAVLYKKDDNEISSVFKSSIKVEAVNKIGCGDTFGAVFFYNYLKTKNEADALQKANTAAGIAASYKTINDFVNLKNDVLSRYN